MVNNLKPYREYKKSGLAWLEKIPSHWNVLPNRALFLERITKGNIQEELLSVTIQGGVIKQTDLLLSSIKKDSSNEDKSKYKLVMPGDIAYNKMRMWQGAVGASKYRGIVSPAYIVVTPRLSVNYWYYHFLFRTPTYIRESYRYSYGICDDQLSLRFKDFKVILSPLPPLEEQNKIVNFLLDLIKKVDNLFKAYRHLVGVSKSVAERKNSLLYEYRTRLISDVVTGKVDVRDIPVEQVEDIEVIEGLEEIQENEELTEPQEVADADN